MGISFQRVSANALQQGGKIGIVVEFALQHQIIHKKADEIFQLGLGAVGNGRTDQNDFLTRVTVEQCLKSG